MTTQEILAAFEQAERDWSLPIETARENYTYWGLCEYFMAKQKISGQNTYSVLAKLWATYATKNKSMPIFEYQFVSHGNDPQGRAERLEAIRKVIKDLKAEINGTV